MDSYRDFTFHPFNYPVDKVKSFVQDLHARHQHYVLIVDPAIKVEDNYMPYVTGMSKGLFIRQADGSVFHGKVWPGCVGRFTLQLIFCSILEFPCFLTFSIPTRKNGGRFILAILWIQWIWMVCGLI